MDFYKNIRFPFLLFHDAATLAEASPGLRAIHIQMISRDAVCIFYNGRILYKKTQLQFHEPIASEYEDLFL